MAEVSKKSDTPWGCFALIAGFVIVGFIIAGERDGYGETGTSIGQGAIQLIGAFIFFGVIGYCLWKFWLKPKDK